MLIRDVAVTVVLLYAATYTLGMGLCRLARYAPAERTVRFAVFSGVGIIALGWVGYVAAVCNVVWVAAAVVWGAAGAGVVLAAWQVWRRRSVEGPSPQPSPRGRGGTPAKILVAAVALALLIVGVRQMGQVQTTPQGELKVRGAWGDLLYRTGVMGEVMEPGELLEWPWLAGQPLRGMSLFRYTALSGVLRAGGVAPSRYLQLSTWLGLYGISVAAAAVFALFLRLGATPTVAAWGVLITTFCGNPRWLLADRFAHSPVLTWAGIDVFAVSVPVFVVTMVLLVEAMRRPERGPLALALLAMASVVGFTPWFALPVLGGAVLYGLYLAMRRERAALWLTLVAGGIVGATVLMTICGTGASGREDDPPLWALVGLSPLVRDLSWAFPALGEPLPPAPADPGPTAVLKPVQFALTYLVAAVFFVAGSLWVRLVMLADAPSWRWAKLRERPYGLIAAITLVAVFLSVCCDFGRVLMTFSAHDMLRLGFLPLLVANLAVAATAARRRVWLKRGVGVLVVVGFVLYGAWEPSRYILAYRTMPYQMVPAGDVRAAELMRARMGPGDRLLIVPVTEAAGNQCTDDDGYMAALVQRPVFIDNRWMAHKFGQSPVWQARQREVEAFLRETDPSRAAQFLTDNEITWLYLRPGQRLSCDPEALGLVTEATIDEGRVYRRNDQ